MPRICTVCQNPQREAIDAALIDGEPFRHIATRFGTSTGALQRHKRNDISRALAKAQERQDAEYGEALLDRVNVLVSKAITILDRADKQGDGRTALLAIREARSALELVGRISGELHPDRISPNPQPMFMLPQGARVQVNILQGMDGQQTGPSEDGPSRFIDTDTISDGECELKVDGGSARSK